MSNKLTNEKLKELVREVFEESKAAQQGGNAFANLLKAAGYSVPGQSNQPPKQSKQSNQPPKQSKQSPKQSNQPPKQSNQPPQPPKPTPAQQKALDNAIAAINGAKNLPLDAAQTKALQDINDAKASKTIDWSGSTKQIDDAIKYHGGLKTAPKTTKSTVDFQTGKYNKKIAPKTDDFEYAVSNLPQEFKSLILRLFGPIIKKSHPNMTDQQQLDAFAGISESLLSEDTKKIDWEDFAAILANDKSPYYKAAVMAVNQAQNIATASGKYADQAKTLSQLSQNMNILPTGPAGANDPTGTPTISISDAFGGVARSDVPKYVVDFFENLGLGTSTNVIERINAINNFSAKIAAGSLSKDQATLGEAMSNIAVQSLMAKIAKRMDDKAAGWAFESFLAQLANGTTEGTMYGAADFAFGISPDGALPAAGGSAKLVKSVTTTQALKTTRAYFDDLVNTKKNFEGKMTYIVGRKLVDSAAKADYATPNPAGKKSKYGTADTTLIKKVAIFMFTVHAFSHDGKTVKNKDADASSAAAAGSNRLDIGSHYLHATSHKGEPIKVGFSGSDIKYDFAGTTEVGVIELATDLPALEKKAEQVLTTFGAEIPQLLKLIKVFENSSNSYLTTGELGDLDKSTESYVSLFDKINEVFGTGTGAAAQQSGVTGGIEVSGGKVQQKKARAITENKNKSLKDLDKLIKDVILENMNKK